MQVSSKRKRFSIIRLPSSFVYLSLGLTLIMRVRAFDI
jgi:hypothetical protein